MTGASRQVQAEDPRDEAQVVMHGESHDTSTFIQVGTQIVQPLPPSQLAVRNSLPPDMAAFTGRDKELDTVIAAVSETVSANGALAIRAIEGMPGVGKTTLAVHVAHLLRDQFPDRQLFIDLHAHTLGQDPVPADTALAGLLTAVGVDARYLPKDTQSRIDLWRDRMAGQRALLVLDNAASSEQVVPLLPGSERCLVLVTSRRHLGDLPDTTVSVPLRALSPDHARQMFLRVAPRAAADPGASVAELVRLAGFLPLAISLLARVYIRHPAWTIADLTAETNASLLTLAAEKSSIRAAFDVSYRYLPPDQQQFFSRLGLHPGATIDGYAAAALAGIAVPEAGRHLDALYGEGLLTEASFRRYGMHDLIRRYARDLAADSGQGLERMLDYYQYTAAITEERLARQTRSGHAPASPPVEVPELPDRPSALAWARTERPNLLACLDHATRTGQHARVVGLTAGMAALLRYDGPWTDAITRHSTAVQAARHLGDRLSQANALCDLGITRRLTGDYEASAQALQEALGVYRDLADWLGQANVLYNMGTVRRLTGDYRGAVEAHTAALGIFHDLADRIGQASVLNDLGAVRHLTGDFPGAAEAHAAAVDFFRDLGDQSGLAGALNDLGTVRRLTGDFTAAAEAHAEALAISRAVGLRMGIAGSLNHLGTLRRQTGDLPGAAQALEAARSICYDLGDRQGQAGTLYELGAVRRLAGDLPGAAEALEEALTICRNLGDRGGEVTVLNEVGELHRVRGDFDQAVSYHRQALELATEIAGRWDEAHAHAGLGRCAIALSNAADGKAHLRQALEILRGIGAADAIVIAAELDALGTHH